MPVYVQWKWAEKTETLLAIFHFYDDFSRPNLRLMQGDEEKEAWVHKGTKLEKPNRAWITWAPSHPEMALVMQLLCYANIINGLNLSKKKKLWIELEGKSHFRALGYSEETLHMMAVPAEIMKEIGFDKKVLTYADSEDEETLVTCAELCPEYLEYLGRILKQFLK
jgi:hypothetical protein